MGGDTSNPNQITQLPQIGGDILNPNQITKHQHSGGDTLNPNQVTQYLQMGGDTSNPNQMAQHPQMGGDTSNPNTPIWMTQQKLPTSQGGRHFKPPHLETDNPIEALNKATQQTPTEEDKVLKLLQKTQANISL